MPIGQLVKNNAERIADLQNRLAVEWKFPGTSSIFESAPVLIEDEQPARIGQSRTPIHLYAIWDEWADLSQTERSEILTDAYTKTHPNNILRVTLAMGLTHAEAAKMGLSYKIK